VDVRAALFADAIIAAAIDPSYPIHASRFVHSVALANNGIPALAHPAGLYASENTIEPSPVFMIPLDWLCAKEIQ
jgi:hypothetical protein